MASHICYTFDGRPLRGKNSTAAKLKSILLRLAVNNKERQRLEASFFSSEVNKHKAQRVSS